MTNEQYLNFLLMFGGGSAFTGLLDTYSGAKAAFSLRRLSSDYNGSAVQVRNKSTQTITDIGFDADGIIDTTALATAANETGDTKQLGIVTWYDQSGNGNNATQNAASKQPNIYFGSGPVLENGKLAISFDGSDDSLDTPSITHGTDDISIIGVFMNELNTGDQSFVSGQHGSAMQWSRIRNNAWSPFLNTGTSTYSFTDSSFNNNQQYLYESYYASDWNVYANNQNLGTETIGVHDDIGSGIYRLSGLTNNTDYLQGNIQEVVIYSNDQSSNRSGIETNINDYYSIY